MIGELRALRQSAADFLKDLRTVLGSGVRRLPLIAILMLIATALDLLGVALIAPFASLLLQGAPVSATSVRGLAGLGVATLGAVVFTVFLLKGTAAYLVQKRITRLSEGERARLMARLLAAYQAQPYEFHLGRNTTDLVNRVVWYTQAFATGLLGSLLRCVADGLVFIALGVFLAWSDLRAVALLGAILLAVFLVVNRVVRARLVTAATASAAHSAGVMHAVNQALGALREIRILGREQYFRERLEASAAGLVDAAAAQSALQLVPRQAVEVAMIGFLVLLVLASQSGDATIVPLLAMFAAAAVRLMPASTSILSSWNNVRANRFALRALAEELRVLAPEREVVRDRPLEPLRELVLRGVSYSYPGSDAPALSGLDLEIASGDVVGVMGRSGAGKSTLADVMLGLLAPSEGVVELNGRNVRENLTDWHARVAYIPQSPYLLDDTLRRNVALGVPDSEIDDARVSAVMRQAQLGDLLATLPRGLDTQVGERGVRLSGGQRQRVAIARALYHDREFLILDEATSALDSETEQAIVQSVDALRGSRTFVIIAHRESTLAHANRIVRLDTGRIEVVERG